MALTEAQKQFLAANSPKVDEVSPPVETGRKPNNSYSPQYSPYGISVATSSGEGRKGFEQGAGAAATESLRYGVPVAATLAGGPGVGMLARAGLGVLGGALGEQAAQETELTRGVRSERSPGATVASGVVSLVPGGKGLGGTMGRATLDATTNVVAETARSVIDEGKLPGWKQAALAGTLGFGAGAAMGAGGKVTSNQVLSEIDTIARERNKLFGKMRPEGFKISPDHLSDVGVLNWLAGRSQTANKLSLDNQVAAQKFVRKAIGSKGGDRFKLEKKREGLPTLEKDRSEIRKLMDKAAKPMSRLEKYSDDINKWAADGSKNPRFEGLTPDQVRLVAGGKQTLKDIRSTRVDKSKAWKAYANSGDPKLLDEFKRLEAEEKMLDDRIDSIAKTLGDKKLLKDIKSSRIQLAKLFVVENITDPATGLVELDRLRPMLEKIRLTGELEDLAKFASMFDIDARPVKQAMMDAPVNFSARLTGTAAAAGAPAVATTSMAMPIIGRGARGIIRDPVYQNLFVKPNAGGTENLIGRAIRLGVMGEGRGESDSSILSEMLKQSAQE